MDEIDELYPPDSQYVIQEVTPETAPGWTARADIAADEAEPYFPPTDPPVIPGGDQGVEIATGFGTSPEDSPFRADAPQGDGWIQDEVERVLREDSATSVLALRVRVEDGTATIYGVVSDVADAESAEAVASQVPGVVAVIDRTEVDPSV